MPDLLYLLLLLLVDLSRKLFVSIRKGIMSNEKMNRPGRATPVVNLSYALRRNAYSTVLSNTTHGTVMPGGTLGSTLVPCQPGDTLTVSMMHRLLPLRLGRQKLGILGKCTTLLVLIRQWVGRIHGMHKI